MFHEPDARLGNIAVKDSGALCWFLPCSLWLLFPEPAAQPETEDEDGEEQDAEGGSEGLVAGSGELVVDDFSDGRIGAATH